MPKIIDNFHFFMRYAEFFGFSRRKDRVRVYLDFLHCKYMFHCEPDEYFLMHYYKYKNGYRKYFLTFWNKRHTLRYINKAGLALSKIFCYERLKTFYGREIVAVSEISESEFSAFVKKHGKVFFKPDKDSCGRGAEIFEYTDEKSCRQKYEESVKNDIICEELIVQRSEISEICPSSVNSCRIMTLRENDSAKIIAATFKMSKGKAFVDNLHANGIGAEVDIDTGVVTTVGRDYEDKTYIYHPTTGKIIPGIQLPFWKEALLTVKEAHEFMPESAVLGWDIAFTEKGPIIIEVNGAPGPKIHQFADKEPKGKPILDYVKVKSNRTYNPKQNTIQ